MDQLSNTQSRKTDVSVGESKSAPHFQLLYFGSPSGHSLCGSNWLRWCHKGRLSGQPRLCIAFAVRFCRAKKKAWLEYTTSAEMTDMPLQPHNTSSYVGFKWIVNCDIEGQRQSCPQLHNRLNHSLWSGTSFKSFLCQTAESTLSRHRDKGWRSEITTSPLTHGNFSLMHIL